MNEKRIIDYIKSKQDTRSMSTRLYSSSRTDSNPGIEILGHALFNERKANNRLCKKVSKIRVQCQRGCTPRQELIPTPGSKP